MGITLTPMEAIESEARALEEKLERARQRQADLQRKQAELLADRRKAWAAGVIDTWPSDFDEAAQATEAARHTFNTSVIEHGLGEATIGAYLEWHRCFAELTIKQQRHNRAMETLSRVSFSDTVHGSYRPPTFAEAVSRALDAALPPIRQAVTDAYHAELAGVDSGNAR